MLVQVEIKPSIVLLTVEDKSIEIPKSHLVKIIAVLTDELYKRINDYKTQ